mmetsp:Transcript_42170/g.140172  ORF Transcript_42170/g.140172 Transcript_42170/m.140172 type:complete len:206 (+) Transcript_42170:3595-4212(+)
MSTIREYYCNLEWGRAPQACCGARPIHATTCRERGAAKSGNSKRQSALSSPLFVAPPPPSSGSGSRAALHEDGRLARGVHAERARGHRAAVRQQVARREEQPRRLAGALHDRDSRVDGRRSHRHAAAPAADAAADAGGGGQQDAVGRAQRRLAYVLEPGGGGDQRLHSLHKGEVLVRVQDAHQRASDQLLPRKGLGKVRDWSGTQ